MPKRTFFNLPDEKRQKIIDVAIEEFAANGYAGTSINSIVSRLDIAKGSIYQYFDNKKDFYLYLVKFVKESYMEHRAEFVGNLEKQPVMDILHKTMLSFRDFRENFPIRVSFYFTMVGDTSIPFVEEISRIMTEPSLKYMRGIIDSAIKRGELREDIDIDMLVFDLVMLITAFQQATVNPVMARYYNIDTKSKKSVSVAAERLLDIVFKGIGKR